MSVFAWLLLSVPATALAVHLVSCLLAYLRFRKSPGAAPSVPRPGVSVIRPLCGLEPFSDETLRSTFLIDYPEYEVIFCVAKSSDPILPLVRALLTSYPEQRARVLIGEDAFSANPKLNNMAKGFRAACFEHIVFVDSNVFTPPDYLDQLMAILEDGAGMVTAPPVGHAPVGFWAELECAFLNSYQARMQYAIDTLGLWKRQVRWARLRRASFPLLFAPEILAGPWPPLLALVAGLCLLGLAWPMAALAFLALWYAPELLLLRIAGWPRSLAALLLRDAMLPAVFMAGCAGSSFEWHGKKMVAARGTPAPSRLARMNPKLLLARLAARFD